jgi:hypothetical protein
MRTLEYLKRELPPKIINELHNRGLTDEEIERHLQEQELHEHLKNGADSDKIRSYLGI